MDMDQDEPTGGVTPQKPAQEPEIAPWNEPDFRNLEDQNLVPILERDSKGKEWLARFADQTIKEKNEDAAGCESYYEILAWATELYAGMSKEFTYGPAEGEKKPCLPTLAKIVQRIYSRTCAVVNNTDPVAVPSGEEDHDRAMRLAQHMSWERRAKQLEWKPTMAHAVLIWALYGSMIRKVVWDVVKRRKCVQTLTPEDVILPYTDKDTSPNLENVERITEVMHLPKWRIKKLGKLKFFHGVDELFSKDAERKPTTVNPSEGRKIREVVNSLQGTKPSNSAVRGSTYRFLERQSWEELPGDEDNPRRISCVIEESTKRVVRLVIKERENPADRLRYENDLEFEALRIKNDSAAAGQVIDDAAAKQTAQARVKPPQLEPVYDYVHYTFSPNPEGGIYGYGAWVFVGGLNDIMNELAGEDILARRLVNVAGCSGFIDAGVTVERGKVKLEYGNYKQVTTTTGNLSGSIWTIPFQPPRGNAMEWIERLDQEAQAVMSSSDYQSGMPGPSHETAAAAKLRVAAGNTAITQAIEVFLVPLACEYRMSARLSATYMSDAEYFLVVEPDPTNPGQTKRVPVGVSREDYEEDFDVTFDSDVRLRIDPGLGENALSAYQLVMSDPELQGELNLKMAARKKALKALECPDLANMLPDEVPPPPPPEPMSQENENAMFMNEEDHPVLDDDPHEDHVAKMAHFKETGMYNELSPTGKQLFDRHERKHKSVLYLIGTRIMAGAPPNTGLPGGPPAGPGGPA